MLLNLNINIFEVNDNYEILNSQTRKLNFIEHN